MKNLATEKFRWIALIFLAIGLAIVIIDNTVLNVAIPYILRDLNTSVDAIQWVVSGYALIIATLLVTIGRLGDLVGRKRIFILGIILFAIGSFIASIAANVIILFIGEALIEAVGAAMMLTSSLSLLASEFHGRERAIAFGVWGSVAGASASIGPLLGGFLTTYYSWRWSLRINVVVALIAIAGTVFIKESKGEQGKTFDWWGTLFSGTGLFSLVFGLIEGQKYGWIKPNEVLSINGWTWPLSSISIIPFAFGLAALLLTAFVIAEIRNEKAGGHPLLRISMFRSLGFSVGLLTLTIVTLGQFGVFFILPIFLQNVLGMNAFETGLTFLWTSVTIFFFGPLSGFLSSKFGTKWLIAAGMIVLSLGVYILINQISAETTSWTLAPALVLFGIGIGVPSAQLTNTILSAVPVTLAGEASAVNSTARQVGTSIGIAIIGAVLVSSLSTNIGTRINSDSAIPSAVKTQITPALSKVNVEAGTKFNSDNLPKSLVSAVKADVKQGMVDSSKDALKIAYIFILLGTAVAMFLPNAGHSVHPDRPQTQTK